MQFDRGYVSPYFVSDLQRMEASLDEPYVLLTDKKISGTSDLLPLLEKLVQELIECARASAEVLLLPRSQIRLRFRTRAAV